ncbi:MAG: hypothetical protein AAFV95_06255 [Bacteroidota bacterium]
MKKEILIVALFWLAIGTVSAQPIALTGELAVEGMVKDWKGEVREIRQRGSSRFSGIYFHFYSIKTYQGSQLVRTSSKGAFGDSEIAYSYGADGTVRRRETKELDQKTGKVTRTKVVTYEYKDGKIVAEYDMADPILNLSKEILRYDEHRRLVTYQKYDKRGDISYDLAHTYVEGSTDKRVDNSLTVTYLNGNVQETRILKYHSEPYRINGEECTKVRIEKSITGEDASKSRAELAYIYVKEDGTVLRSTAHMIGIPILYEWVYEYDKRGNWISKAEFRKSSGMLESYEQRRITYSDGFVSGSDDYDKETIWTEKKFVPSEEQFYYRRLLDKNQFKAFNRNNKNISKGVRFLGDLSTNSAFIHYPEKNTLIELVDYKLIKNGDLHEARSMGAVPGDDYLLKSSAGRFFIFGNHQLISSFEQTSVTSDLGLIFDPATEQSYTYNWSPSAQSEILPLQKLPPTEKNTYWMFATNKEGQPEIMVFRDGKLIDHKGATIVKLSQQDALFQQGDDRLFLKDAMVTKANQLLPTRYLTKEEATALQPKKAATPPKQTATAAAPSSTVPAAPTTAAADRSNFGCYKDIACLNKYAIRTFQEAKRAGQSEEAAYGQMAKVVEQVYNNQPSLSFDMVMKVEDKYLLGLQKALPSEVRQYVRQRSRETVNQYTKKHGKPKIKTVPYRPKN